MYPPVRAHWRHLANTIELVLPSAYPSPQPKWQIDRFSHFAQLTAESPYTLHWAPLSPRLPLPMANLDLHLTRFLGPIRDHSPNSTSISSAVFAPMTPECSYTLQWFALSPPQNCPFPWGSGSPCNTWFFRPTQVLNPNGISIASAVSAWLTSVTDRQADRQTDRPRYTRSVTVGRI